MKAEPRIAFFTDSFLEVNGVAHTSRQLAAFAERRKLPFLAVHAAPETGTVRAGSLTRLGLKRSRAAFGIDADLHFDVLMWRHARLAVQAVREFGADAAHVTGPSDVGLLGVYVARCLGLPLVLSWHTNVHEYAGRRLNRITSFLPASSREALTRAYANFDLFIFPSATDTFGNVVLEAMASGVPAIVSPHGGPRFIVRDDESGVVAGGARQFAEAVLTLQLDPARHARMREAAPTGGANGRAGAGSQNSGGEGECGALIPSIWRRAKRQWNLNEYGSISRERMRLLRRGNGTQQRDHRERLEGLLLGFVCPRRRSSFANGNFSAHATYYRPRRL